MKANVSALLLLASVAAATPSSTAGEFEERQIPYKKMPAIRGATPETGVVHEKRGIWLIAEAGITLFKFVLAGLEFLESPPPVWEPESNNCVIEVKANTHADGRAECSISGSPKGEPAFTTFGNEQWQDCSIGAINKFTFPDAPGRPGPGAIEVQWTRDGPKEGAGGNDGFWAPELGFMELNPAVWFSAEKSLESEGNVICNMKIDDGSLSDKWSGWHIYKCGVPCRDAADDFTVQG
ncbi:uncharacterized protein B0I36DRAFT_416106 [Microdochium trichocladiopsis]|uniref:Uncharacterized protein n=1 Tax=Microdochium trichocladiopsis TaxID=1682393 RepID=A0A9P9BLP9_9PEZI|nr:uncharacterized protein B0I36DRAFT_416106 [Microdochium trichocladiopsis]KAH7024640.1 hypothetical protein B0I36DRAFT_416106 [Microdochium trichocladiopsis]